MAWEKSTPRVSVGVLHVTIVKIIIYVFFFCSLFNYRFSNIYWVLGKDPAHIHISLFGSQSDVRGQQRVESLFPRKKRRLGAVRDTPMNYQELWKWQKTPGLFEKTGRKGKVLKSWDGKGLGFQKGWREGLEAERKWGERQGYSVKYRPVDLVLILGRTRGRIMMGWSVRLGPMKQGLPRGCRLLDKPSQSNLVSSPDRVIRLVDQRIWISARHLTESLRIFLWTRRRNGDGTRGRLSEFVAGWTSVSKALINRVMSAWEEGAVCPGARFCSVLFNQLISVLSGVVGGRLVRTWKDINTGQ